ncbi:GIY-YIG nuclease family protein [Patescibacteria group bacterium]|nr:GIY-YIG nuclease family protein [Patescibacteria group bacterium]MBU1890187.1 GIY-YIG nuclease family protein [Patescibacteria group bacterium]
MFYVYYLISTVNKDLYIGSTNNIKNRFIKHNKGKVGSTKAYKPWKMLGYESFSTRSEAMRRERFLKTHQQKDLLRERFNLAS